MSSPYGPGGGEHPRWGQQQPGYGSPYGGQPQQPGYGGQPPQYGQPQQPYGYPHQQPPYGAPPQYGQQPGQWQQPHPGHTNTGQQPFQAFQTQPPYGQPHHGAPRKKRSALPWVLLAIGIAVIVGGVVAALALSGALGRTTFDNVAVQDGVRKILTEEYQRDVGAVSCPAGQEVKTGRTFNCSVTVDGEERQVTITIKTDSGEYEVGEPK